MGASIWIETVWSCHLQREGDSSLMDCFSKILGFTRQSYTEQMPFTCTFGFFLSLTSRTFKAPIFTMACYKVTGRLAQISSGHTSPNLQRYSGHVSIGAYDKPHAEGSSPTSRCIIPCASINLLIAGYQFPAIHGIAPQPCYTGDGLMMRPYTS